MKRLGKVLRIEMRETISEIVRKTRRRDYVRGGYRVEETIFRVTVVAPFALLECGHWRQEDNYGTVISTAKRLVCHECQQINHERKRAERELFNA